VLAITDDWKYRGFQTVILENDALRVVLTPEIGARVIEFFDKKNNVDLLWRNPRNDLRAAVFHPVNSNDWWTGGIDDIFPTDFPCEYQGEPLPFLGELWSVSWAFTLSERSGTAVEASFAVKTLISPFEVQKRVRLERDADFFEISFRITNIGYGDYEFFFGIHPGVAVYPGSRLIFPITRAVVDENWPAERFCPKGTEYSWPRLPLSAGGACDLSTVPEPSERIWVFHYGVKLERGYLAVWHPTLRQAYATIFDPGVFRHLLFYLGYGGWRHTYSVIPQIATGYPAALTEAIKAGRQKSLQPGRAWEAAARFFCLTGVEREEAVIRRLENESTAMGEA
jgi:hypothetical protein